MPPKNPTVLLWVQFFSGQLNTIQGAAPCKRFPLVSLPLAALTKGIVPLCKRSKENIFSQFIVIIQIFIAQTKPHNPLPHDLKNAQFDFSLISEIRERFGKFFRYLKDIEKGKLSGQENFFAKKARKSQLRYSTKQSSAISAVKKRNNQRLSLVIQRSTISLAEKVVNGL